MKNTLLLFSIIVLLQSCGTKTGAQHGEQQVNESISIEFLRHFVDEPGNQGDIIEYDFQLVYNDKILSSTYGIPDYRERAIIIDPAFDADYMHVMQQLSIDDSIIIKTRLSDIPSEHRPTNINSDKGYLELTVSVRNIWNEEDVLNEMVNQLSENKPESWTKTGRGVRVFWDERGNDVKAEYGDSVTIHVKGLFPSGVVFMDTHAAEPLTFLLGEGTIEPFAWEDACSLTHEGDKITVLSPFDMAFGAKDRKPILKYSILVFEIDVIEIKKN